MKSSIHIVCLDVPYPPNYGGAIDMFYRIKAFADLGYKITLHTFEYGRGKHKELNEICETVHYYKRKTGILAHVSQRPYIVESRINKTLLTHLKKDNNPIWLEGLHCCCVLEDQEIQKRAVFVRMHNIEHDYYNALAKQSKGWRKLFFQLEAKKLKRYESILTKATGIFAIQKKDVNHFTTLNRETKLLPPAFPMMEIEDFDLKDYHLFHGNLSVPENEQAAIWLIENVMKKLPHEHFVIAGKNPSEKLKKLVKSQKQIELIENPNDWEMNKWIGEAKNHLLYTEQSTGVKLKLIHVLQAKGHVIVNPLMVEGTDFGAFCRIANTAEDFITLIQNNDEPMSCSTRIRWKYLQEIRPENTLMHVINPSLFRYL